MRIEAAEQTERRYLAEMDAIESARRIGMLQNRCACLATEHQIDREKLQEIHEAAGMAVNTLKLRFDPAQILIPRLVAIIETREMYIERARQEIEKWLCALSDPENWAGPVWKGEPHLPSVAGIAFHLVEVLEDPFKKAPYTEEELRQKSDFSWPTNKAFAERAGHMHSIFEKSKTTIEKLNDHARDNRRNAAGVLQRKEYERLEQAYKRPEKIYLDSEARRQGAESKLEEENKLLCAENEYLRSALSIAHSKLTESHVHSTQFDDCGRVSMAGNETLGMVRPGDSQNPATGSGEGAAQE